MIESYCIAATKLIDNSIPELFMGRADSGIDMLHEFSARTCYASLDRFCGDPGFLNRLAGWGHHDVFEHSHLQFAFEGADDFDALELALRRANPYVSIASGTRLFESRIKHLKVFASFRVWGDLINKGVFKGETVEQIREVMWTLAPHSCMFGPVEPASDSLETLTSIPNPNTIELSTGARITLLARAWPMDENMREQAAATIFFEGVSRNLTHQLVRHRRGSFSQESQRYVKASSDDAFVIPAGIGDEDFTKRAGEALGHYHSLVATGTPPEDARFILPSAMRTKIVTTMTMADWSHFIYQRALDNAAQWEIREAAQVVLRLFEYHMFPFMVNEVKKSYDDGFRDKSENFRLIENALPIARMMKSKGAAKRARRVKDVHSN